MILIGSRGSDLALAQARWIQNRILELFPDIDTSIEIIKTSGDKDTTSSIRAGSSVGVFVKELEKALMDGKIDLAVHSMKDLPTSIQEGLQISAIPEREDVRDVLMLRCAKGLSDLPPGSRIGTGSVRRQAQLLAIRPDLQILDIRGNINTRLRKLEEGHYDGIILARAGLNRIHLQPEFAEILNLKQMLPAPGQGALALETRSEDHETIRIAGALNHQSTSMAVRAERAFLNRLEGGCNLPIAVHASVEKESIDIEGLVISPDGRKIIRDSVREQSESFLEAALLLADRIIERGGDRILTGR